MNIDNPTMKFFCFLSNCQFSHIKLKDIDINDEKITFHFVKERFLGNNSFFYDDDLYCRVAYNLCKDEIDLYNIVIDFVSKHYNLKSEFI